MEVLGPFQRVVCGERKIVTTIKEIIEGFALLNLMNQARTSLSSTWMPLCPRAQLNLATTLFNGQSFSWRQVGPHHFANVVLVASDLNSETSHTSKAKSALVTLRQAPDDSDVLYRTENENSPLGLENVRKALEEYFLLNVDADALFDAWNEKDGNFLKRTAHLKGTRLLRQPPVETCFSFICSANNNISRITGMVENLKKEYGKLVGKVDASSLGLVEGGDTFALDSGFYSFPEPEDMCTPGVEQTLRELGFGYRAGYIAKTAIMLKAKDGGGSYWLHSLRSANYDDAKDSLLELMGS
ncbi:UNVERIFIED_CONTAM: 8-oxoguanine glycosylase ogg1 [Siphonaria sp. JEL0065]|nr:8-oxoguanine glycosylase ogg1 [Siphonaria sp. JEL0065]